MTEYFDVRCFDDLDPFGRDATPIEALEQDLYHLLITEVGTLLADPEFGFGLLLVIGRPLSSTLATRIEDACRDDDRVSDARCAIAPIPNERDAYRMDLRVEVDGAFLDLALALTPAGARRLAA